MKQKILITIAIILFVAINTTYFWETKVGIFLIPISGIMFLLYLYLSITFFIQLFYAIEEKFTVKKRRILILVLPFILILIFVFPRGIYDFEKLTGYDLMIVGREGAANCSTTYKLKENNKSPFEMFVLEFQKQKNL